MEDEEHEDVEDLREGEFDGLGQFLHDGRRQEEDERAEESTQAEGVPQRWGVAVDVCWTEPEGHRHVGETEEDHDQIEHEPLSLDETPPAKEIVPHSTVECKEDEADELYGLCDATGRVVEVRDVVSYGRVRRDTERGGVLEEGED